MSRKRFVAAFALITLFIGGASYAAETVNNPDPSAVLLLQYKYAGVAPPYELLAQSDSTVTSADEFHKQGAIKQAEAGLREKAASLDAVKTLVVNTESSFSEYDAQNQEYDLDINDGTFLSYNNVFGKNVQIQFANGTAAQLWKISSKDAEDVLRRNHGSRNVTLVLTLSLLASTPSVDNEAAVLNAKIVHYDILSSIENAKLGHVVVEGSH